MAKITYANKIFLNGNPEIPDENKVNDSDLNEIKEIVNANSDMVACGWNSLPVQVTITPSTYYSDVKTSICETSVDLTSYLSVGMKIKFNQDGATKYAFITKMANNQLTLYMGNDYSLSNSTISNFYYSMLKAPYGFPLKRESWDIIKTITTTTGENNPSKGSYYQLENMTITVPIGEWEVGWQANIYPQRTGTGTNEQQSGLSTSLTEPSNPELFATIFTTGNTTQDMANMGRNSNYYFDSKKTFYFLARTTQSNITYIGIYANNSYGYATLYAKCQYL